MTKPKKTTFGIALLAAALLLPGCSVLYVMTGRNDSPWPPENVVKHTPIYHQGDWTIARGSMHNHTVMSDGARTPEQLLELARMEGMAVLAYSDHREGDIALGGGLKIPINGIERIGYDEYFRRVQEATAGADDVITLLGIEVVPYFYNVGRPPFFVVFNENHHFTVYNISDPEVYKDMPARRGLKSFKPEPLIEQQPYAELVDYFAGRGGIVHAVHVESKQDMWVAGIAHFVDRMHPEFVHDLKRLTGFSVVPEAYMYAGAPGGPWDAALIEYLVGGRTQVPWCMGDADYHGPDGSLARGTTLFYLRDFTRGDVIAALQDGRMVALMGEKFQDCYVSEFSAAAEGQAAPDPIMLGQKTAVSGPAVVRFALDRELPGVKTELIKNGEVVAEAAGSALEFTDREMFDHNLPAVYRVRVSDPSFVPDPKRHEWDQEQSLLFTNPIFVYPAPGK